MTNYLVYHSLFHSNLYMLNAVSASLPGSFFFFNSLKKYNKTSDYFKGLRFSDAESDLR